MLRYAPALTSLLLICGTGVCVSNPLEFPPAQTQSQRQAPVAPAPTTPESTGTAPTWAPAAEPGGTGIDRDSRSGIPAQSFTIASETSELAPGDTVMYSVAEDAGTKYEGTRELRVGADGKLEIPLLGPIPAGRKTVRQVQESIKSGLERDYYQTATVRLSLMSRLPAGAGPSIGSVYVTGEVNRPGRVEIPPNETFTLTKALTQAGEFGRFANKKEVLLIRKTKDGKTDTQKYNFLDIQDGKAPDVELKHDDTIRVKEKWINLGG